VAAGCRQVRGPRRGVVEIGGVASGAHGSRNRANEPSFARGRGNFSNTSKQISRMPWKDAFLPVTNDSVIYLEKEKASKRCD
jgi:hypothetical protein